MKRYILSALTLTAILPAGTLGAAAREQETQRSLISVPGALSGALKNTWNTTVGTGVWAYVSARGYYAALREYQKNKKYWDRFFYESAEECRSSCGEYTTKELFEKVKKAILADLTSADARVVKNCTLVAVAVASLVTAAYYLEKAAQVEDLSSYTDGTEHAQTRLAELARTHENSYFTYYGAGARAIKNEIKQLKKELAALDRQQRLEDDYRVSTLHKQGMLARWYTQWLFSGISTSVLFKDDGTLNVAGIEDLLAMSRTMREQRRQELQTQLAHKRLELQECIKGHILEQKIPSQYSASLGAGLAGLATLIGSGYALAKVNHWL
jgi:hypothetical protein